MAVELHAVGIEIPEGANVVTASTGLVWTFVWTSGQTVGTGPL